MRRAELFQDLFRAQERGALMSEKSSRLFLQSLIDSGIDFFAGVPDSYLHGFCSLLSTEIDKERNIITANEGNAIGVAVGHFLSTGRIPLVYMQNSGLGNAINPLVSLACKDMLSIPMVLLIGWRGDPLHSDHIQHSLQGQITPGLLVEMGIPYRAIAEGQEAACARWAAEAAVAYRAPVALLSPKGVLNGTKKPSKDETYPLSREDAIRIIVESSPENAIFSATTGRASRELYAIREELDEAHINDYLNVGSMGHASSVALGMALGCPSRRIVCLDGDAAVIMHMGALTMPSKLHVPNLLHVVLNNGMHESVGGQPSAGWKADFTAIASASGYETIGRYVSEAHDLSCAVKELCDRAVASFLEVRIHSGIRSDMPVLEVNPIEMRRSLLKTMCG